MRFCSSLLISTSSAGIVVSPEEDSLHIDRITVEDQGLYTCRASNPKGSAESSAYIWVNGKHSPFFDSLTQRLAKRSAFTARRNRKSLDGDSDSGVHVRGGDFPLASPDAPDSKTTTGDELKEMFQLKKRLFLITRDFPLCAARQLPEQSRVPVHHPGPGRRPRAAAARATPV